MVSMGVKGGILVSQGVMRCFRGVPGVKGRLGDPRGLKGTSGVYQGVKGAPGVSKGVKMDVWGVPRGSRGMLWVSGGHG